MQTWLEMIRSSNALLNRGNKMKQGKASVDSAMNIYKSDSKSLFDKSSCKNQNEFNIEDVAKASTPLKWKIKANKLLESKISLKILAYCRQSYSDHKFKKFWSRLTHEYCPDSTFNLIIKYWEMFCVLFSMLSNKTINQNEDSALMLELWKMLNYKLNRNSDYLIPSKELFIEVKQHWLQTLLSLIKEDGQSVSSCILSPRNNNFKAFVMPHNNGKLVASILKRRAWWKILKHQTDYDFIWTPLLRRGKRLA